MTTPHPPTETITPKMTLLPEPLGLCSLSSEADLHARAALTPAGSPGGELAVAPVVSPASRKHPRQADESAYPETMPPLEKGDGMVEVRPDLVNSLSLKSETSAVSSTMDDSDSDRSPSTMAARRVALHSIQQTTEPPSPATPPPPPLLTTMQVMQHPMQLSPFGQPDHNAFMMPHLMHHPHLLPGMATGMSHALGMHHRGIPSVVLSRMVDSPSPTHEHEDNKNGGGSCHQCKTARARVQLLVCTRMGDRCRKRRCRKKFCHACLLRSYGVNVNTLEQEEIDNWLCPACNNTCICAACGRRGSTKAAPGGPQPIPPLTSAGQMGVGSQPITPTTPSQKLAQRSPHTNMMPPPPLPLLPNTNMGQLGANMFGSGLGNMAMPAQQGWPLMPMQGGVSSRSVSAHVAGVKTSPQPFSPFSMPPPPPYHHQAPPNMNLSMGLGSGPSSMDIMSMGPSSMSLPFHADPSSAGYRSSGANTPAGSMASSMMMPFGMAPLAPVPSALMPLPAQPSFGPRGVNRLASAPAAMLSASANGPGFAQPHLQPHTLAQAASFAQNPQSLNLHPSKAQKLSHGSYATSNDVHQVPSATSSAVTMVTPPEISRATSATLPTTAAATAAAAEATPAGDGGAANDAADALAFLAATAAGSTPSSEPNTPVTALPPPPAVTIAPPPPSNALVQAASIASSPRLAPAPLQPQPQPQQQSMPQLQSMAPMAPMISQQQPQQPMVPPYSGSAHHGMYDLLQQQQHQLHQQQLHHAHQQQQYQQMQSSYHQQQQYPQYQPMGQPMGQPSMAPHGMYYPSPQHAQPPMGQPMSWTGQTQQLMHPQLQLQPLTSLFAGQQSGFNSSAPAPMTSTGIAPTGSSVLMPHARRGAFAPTAFKPLTPLPSSAAATEPHPK